MSTFLFALRRSVLYLILQLLAVWVVVEIINPMLYQVVHLPSCLLGVVFAWALTDGRELLTLWVERKNIHEVTD